MKRNIFRTLAKQQQSKFNHILQNAALRIRSSNTYMIVKELNRPAEELSHYQISKNSAYSVADQRC
jgi:hypothetical protein